MKRGTRGWASYNHVQTQVTATYLEVKSFAWKKGNTAGESRGKDNFLDEPIRGSQNYIIIASPVAKRVREPQKTQRGGYQV